MRLKRWFIWTTILAAALAAPQARAEEQKPPWKARAEISYVRTTGNTSTQTLACRLEASHEPGPNRYYGKAGWMYGKSEGTPTANKAFVDGRYERSITERLFGFATANFSRDVFSGYDYQAYGGAGVGYEFVRTDRHALKGLAGLLYSYDKFSSDAGGHDSYAAAMASAEYGWQITDAVKFKEAADYRVSLEDAGVYFVNSDTSLQIGLASSLSLGLSYLVAYRNEPPSADDKHTDTEFLTSLIFTF